MPWPDCLFQNWEDSTCIWQDWSDCVWDKFPKTHAASKTRTMRRKLPPEGLGNFRRPYLDSSRTYIENSRRYPDTALSNALLKVKGETRFHMTLKQPYRYTQFLQMKYRDEPGDIFETFMDILYA